MRITGLTLGKLCHYTSNTDPLHHEIGLGFQGQNLGRDWKTLLDDPLDINDRSSSSKITLQVAESYLSDPASVPLEEYDSIDSEAAEYLASKNVELDLSGLHSLDDASAKYFSGLWPNFVSLSNRLTLSTEAKQELANGLVGCDSVSYLELSLLKGIKRLDLSGCEHLQELIGLGLLTELQELSLAGCVRLEQLSLENLSSLKVLRLDNCISLKEVDLSSCSDLLEFYFSNCNAPASLVFLSKASRYLIFPDILKRPSILLGLINWNTSSLQTAHLFEPFILQSFTTSDI